MLDALLAGLRARDRRALARLITLVSRGQHLDEIRAQTPVNDAGQVVAITGGGGVGKSTLVGKLIEKLREHGKSVAVLACDPESPFTGGALLGDRYRMPPRPDDAGVYIRSLAAPSGRQAVAEHLDLIVRLCNAFGFDIVLIETVGAGQGDTAVRAIADAVVLLLQPETGDDVQWEKAGVLEVADAVVVHKADLPGSDRAVGQIQAAMELASNRIAPVLAVSSRTGQGLDELVKLVEAFPRRSRSAADAVQDLLRLAQEELATRFARDGLDDIAQRWQRGEIGAAEAIVQGVRKVFP